MQDDAKDQLRSGLQEMGLDLSPEQQESLLDYLSLLQKWNQAFNLSGVRNPGEMLSRHLLDSLTLVPWITGSRLLDVGTGPGLPGIPLAICYPQMRFDLLDSNGKKTRFVFQAALQLGLRNVQAHHLRVEQFQPESTVDMIVCRAFSSLRDLAELTRHLAQPEHTRLLAMKGLYPEAELAELPADVELVRAERVEVPGDAAERHLIELKFK
ncbi:MAG: 16S rRNA (guanine(527)-N(7))-methyltransferase RsmG [Pseudomonadales bacterium]|nr:16S rRNA (guanine(527)-N(7))-methyltransferase RsmG [Pseudomonadales bacterium]MCP5357753.1 16S rRNA (guanine(527)-N(7))-methyltransferase RsmG [Pseudomonadales bacterium]